MSRFKGNTTMRLNISPKVDKISILVENLGRINYGSFLEDRKVGACIISFFWINHKYDAFSEISGDIRYGQIGQFNLRPMENDSVSFKRNILDFPYWITPTSPTTSLLQNRICFTQKQYQMPGHVVRSYGMVKSQYFNE